MPKTTPQDIATILIHEWQPIAKEHGIDVESVPPWIIRACIDHFVVGTVNRNGLRTLFHHYAEYSKEVTCKALLAMLEEHREISC